MVTKNFTPFPVQVSFSKEVEPPLLKETGGEAVREHELKKEVFPSIQKRAETIILPPDLKKLGLQTSTTSRFNYQNIKLPISDDKIITGLHAPITSSLRWLATLALYILHLAHLKLKIVHGHVVRVLNK